MDEYVSVLMVAPRTPFQKAWTLCRPGNREILTWIVTLFRPAAPIPPTSLLMLAVARVVTPLSTTLT